MNIKKYIICHLTLTFVRVNVTKNVSPYPLHYLNYASVKFDVSTSNGLVEYMISRNVTDGRRTDIVMKLTYPIFSLKKRVHV